MEGERERESERETRERGENTSAREETMMRSARHQPPQVHPPGDSRSQPHVQSAPRLAQQGVREVQRH
jgi:hypothetical protein